MQSTLQAVLSAIDDFPWSLSVLLIVIAAMLIFREAIREIISRSHELKAGRYFSLKAKPSRPDQAIAQIVRELSAAGQVQSDVDRLVIRDAQGRPRILASTVESGAPFLALIDEDGEVRATLAAGSAADPADPNEIAMLMFRGKGKAVGDMASFIGAERDGSGAVGVRDSYGSWKEMS
jgi:hypothetical protein